MIVFLLSKLVTNVFGLLYPAYQSFVAVKNKDVRAYVQWMMYWIVFAFYSFFEAFADTFLGPWFPFYYEIKIILLLWLMCPATRGANLIYRKFVHPNLLKYEPEIEHHLASVKDHVGLVVWHWGCRIMHQAQAAIVDLIWGVAERQIKGNLFIQRSSSLQQLGIEHEKNSRAVHSADNSPTDGRLDLDHFISEGMMRDLLQPRSPRNLEQIIELNDGAEDVNMDDIANDSSFHQEPVDAPRSTRSRRKVQTSAINPTAPRVRRARKVINNNQADR